MRRLILVIVLVVSGCAEGVVGPAPEAEPKRKNETVCSSARVERDLSDGTRVMMQDPNCQLTLTE